jgi:hypothetical protein
MAPYLPVLGRLIDANDSISAVSCPSLGTAFRSSSASAAVPEPLVVRVCSWNVNAKVGQYLENWLTSGSTPDILAVGVQEAVPLSTRTVVKDKTAAADRVAQSWRNEVLCAVSNATAQTYTVLRDMRLMGVYLVVLVRSNLYTAVSNVSLATAAFGVMNTVANKGAIAIRLQVHESSFCFVTCHLAAGQHNTEKRNQDYQSILSQVRFEADSDMSSIFDHEYVLQSPTRLARLLTASLLCVPTNDAAMCFGSAI